MASVPTGWADIGSPSARAAGAAWLAAGRTALLRVPSVVVPREANWVVNPTHPDAARIRLGRPEPLGWDPRLFGTPAPR
jgi:RES domain-containing protein